MEKAKTSIVIFLFFVCVTSLVQASDVPTDCFHVAYDTHEECFTFSGDTVYTNHTSAEEICESSGGQLAIVKDERTWQLLIEKFLKSSPYHVWLGYKVDSKLPKLIPEVDLTNMTNYWLPYSLTTSHLGTCVYGDYATRKWNLRICNSMIVPYLCQYFLHCRITEIESARVKVDTRLSTDYIGHNESIEISCEPGYFLNTSTTIKCQLGKWSEKSPCILGCPPPGKRRNAELTLDKSHYSIGDKIYYVCEDNYYNWRNHDKTHFSITCQEDFTWSGEDSGCSLSSDVMTSKVTINSLRCDLNTIDKKWFRNGNEINHFSAIEMTSSGNLIINSTSGYNSGYYICSGIVNGQLEIGRIGYERVIWDKCDIDEQLLATKELTGKEGKNLLVNCPQFYKDHNVKWYKDGEEIVSSERSNIVSGFGLFLKNISIHDEAIYKCQSTFKNSEENCLYIITYYILVSASLQTICGTTRNQIKQPWIVVLHRDDESSPFCYGTLLNEQWVVTSAFCLSCLQRKKNLEGVYIKLGPDDDTQRYEVSGIRVHPGYISRRNENDIGLIKIYGSIKFTKNILPVCISADDINSINYSKQRSNLTGVVPGFGSFDNVGKRRLGVEEFIVVPKEVCRHSKTLGFAEDKFCGKFVGDNETFVGNDGSPFLVGFHGRQHLLGIYTWSERKLGKDSYDYFTSVFNHFDWLKEVIGG